MSKPLWPFEKSSKTHSAWRQFNIYPSFALLHRQHRSDTAFPQFLCVCFPEQSRTGLLAVWSAALQSCTIKSVQPRALFFCRSYDQKCEAAREGGRFGEQGDSEGNTQRLREGKTKRERSKEKRHLAEGRFKRGRSVQGGTERREVRVINTVQRLRSP